MNCRGDRAGVRAPSSLFPQAAGVGASDASAANRRHHVLPGLLWPSDAVTHTSPAPRSKHGPAAHTLPSPGGLLLLHSCPVPSLEAPRQATNKYRRAGAPASSLPLQLSSNSKSTRADFPVVSTQSQAHAICNKCCLVTGNASRPYPGSGKSLSPEGGSEFHQRDLEGNHLCR